MDERIRVRTSNRRPARSADSSRSYPRDERRVLSPETLQGPATAPARSRAGRRRRPQHRRNPRPLIITEPVMRNGPHEGPLRINQPHRRWPTFTPPQWPAFAPPLTRNSAKKFSSSSMLGAKTLAVPEDVPAEHEVLHLDAPRGREVGGKLKA